MQDIELAYRNLASAIIIQAVEDYRNALKGITYKHKSPKTIIEDCEKFFRSSYYRNLTHIDGEYLIEQIRKEQNIERNIDTINA